MISITTKQLLLLFVYNNYLFSLVTSTIKWVSYTHLINDINYNKGITSQNICVCDMQYLKLNHEVYIYIYIYTIIIIIIIMSRHQHGYPWPSLATPPYRPSLPTSPQGYIPYPRRAAVCRFELVILPLLGHVKGSTRVHRLWARPYFFSCVPHVWSV